MSLIYIPVEIVMTHTTVHEDAPSMAMQELGKPRSTTCYHGDGIRNGWDPSVEKVKNTWFTPPILT